MSGGYGNVVVVTAQSAGTAAYILDANDADRWLQNVCDATQHAPDDHTAGASIPLNWRKQNPLYTSLPSPLFPFFFHFSPLPISLSLHPFPAVPLLLRLWVRAWRSPAGIYIYVYIYVYCYLAAISWITVHIHTTIIQRIYNMTKVTKVTKSLKGQSGPGRQKHYSVVRYICSRPSVCRLSVTFVRPTQAIEIFFQCFYAIWYC